MSKQQGIYLHGKSENILYYSWKGIPCERTIPANVYQSPVVVAHKNANGLSTTMGASFRKLLAGIIPYPKSMQMQTTVRLILLKWLKAGPVSSQPPAGIPDINGLSFNEAITLRKCTHVSFNLTVSMQNELSLQVPQIMPLTDFTAPPQTAYIELKLAAACCGVKTGEAIENYRHNITIPYNATNIPAQSIPLPLQMPVNSITLVTAALDYYTYKNGTTSLNPDERFRPGEVIGGVVNMG
jgi:hypothetical protein